DPYEAISQAYLVETDIESEPSKDPIDIETPESPHDVASPAPLPDSTPPACYTKESDDSDTFGVRSTSLDSTAPLSPDHSLTRTSPTPTLTRASFHRKTTRMTVRAQPVMSPGHSARVAEVMALLDSALLKRYRSSYETSSSSSSLDLLARKRYRDEGRGLDDKGHGLDGEGRRVESDGLGLEGEEVTVPEEPERPKRVSALRQPTLTTWINPEDGIAYIDIPTYPPPAKTPPSPEWSFATIPVDEDQFIEIGVQLELFRGILQDHTQRLDVMPPTLFASIDRDVRELYTRPVLALEAWAGHVDTRMVDMSQAGGRVTALEQEMDSRE
nr:hypothetical protein [Tanacetum cinerariifolium]